MIDFDEYGINLVCFEKNYIKLTKYTWFVKIHYIKIQRETHDPLLEMGNYVCKSM